jgi:hypothetical protein
MNKMNFIDDIVYELNRIRRRLIVINDMMNSNL